MWHHESYSLSSYLVRDFKVRFVAKMSSSGEEAAVDNVEVRATGGTARSDTVRPTVTVPADMVRTAPTASGVAVTYTASARDAVDGAIAPVCTPASGSTFAVGSTTVTCEATDNAGNTGRASFTVTVRELDTTSPVISVPASMTHSATSPAGAVVAYDATATDNADASVTPSCAPPSGSTFAVGTTTVRCTAADSSGNRAEAAFTVTVLPFVDTTGPEVTISPVAPSTASSMAGKAVAYTATAADDADGTLTPTCAPASGSAFSVGVTEVTCTATDRAGNTGSATLKVVVNLETGFDSGLGDWKPKDGWAAVGGGRTSPSPASGHPPGSAQLNKVAEADDCDTECTITLGTLDLSGYAAATLEFWRYVDASIDAGEYLQVQARLDRGSWAPLYDWTDGADTLGSWRKESISLADHLHNGVSLRFAALVDGADKEVAVDSVALRGTATPPADTEAPVILAPKSITWHDTTPSSQRKFTVTARDAVDGVVNPQCTPHTSGPFSVGTTTVTCTATDKAGRSDEKSITVTVKQTTTQATPGTLALRGGMPVYWHETPASGGTPHLGTAGVVVTHTSSRPAVVVSSHTTDVIAPANKGTAKLTLSRTFSESDHVGSTVLATTDIVANSVVSSDAALVHVTGSNVSPSTRQIWGNDGVITVSSFGGVAGLAGSPSADPKTVEIVGGLTNSKGALVHADATARITEEGISSVYTGHAIAKYWSTGGDSGAPVMHTDGAGKTALLGIHVGSVKWFTIESSGAVIPQGKPAAPTERGQFGVFSTWENVQRDLGIPEQ